MSLLVSVPISAQTPFWFAFRRPVFAVLDADAEGWGRGEVGGGNLVEGGLGGLEFLDEEGALPLPQELLVRLLLLLLQRLSKDGRGGGLYYTTREVGRGPTRVALDHPIKGGSAFAGQKAKKPLA